MILSCLLSGSLAEGLHGGNAPPPPPRGVDWGEGCMGGGLHVSEGALVS